MAAARIDLRIKGPKYKNAPSKLKPVSKENHKRFRRKRPKANKDPIHLKPSVNVTKGRLTVPVLVKTGLFLRGQGTSFFRRGKKATSLNPLNEARMNEKLYDILNLAKGVNSTRGTEEGLTKSPFLITDVSNGSSKDVDIDPEIGSRMNHKLSSSDEAYTDIDDEEENYEEFLAFVQDIGDEECLNSVAKPDYSLDVKKKLQNLYLQSSAEHQNTKGLEQRSLSSNQSEEIMYCSQDAGERALQETVKEAFMSPLKCHKNQYSSLLQRNEFTPQQQYFNLDNMPVIPANKEQQEEDSHNKDLTSNTPVQYNENILQLIHPSTSSSELSLLNLNPTEFLKKNLNQNNQEPENHAGLQNICNTLLPTSETTTSVLFEQSTPSSLEQTSQYKCQRTVSTLLSSPESFVNHSQSPAQQHTSRKSLFDSPLKDVTKWGYVNKNTHKTRVDLPSTSWQQSPYSHRRRTLSLLSSPEYFGNDSDPPVEQCSLFNVLSEDVPDWNGISCNSYGNSPGVHSSQNTIEKPSCEQSPDIGTIFKYGRKMY